MAAVPRIEMQISNQITPPRRFLSQRQPDGMFSPVFFEPPVHPPAFRERLEELVLRDAPDLRKTIIRDAIHVCFAASLRQLVGVVEIAPKHKGSFLISIWLFNRS